jgi:lipoprotein-anchoring transpeptidase ErfK/SrfK
LRVSGFSSLQDAARTTNRTFQDRGTQRFVPSKLGNAKEKLKNEKVLFKIAILCQLEVNLMRCSEAFKMLIHSFIKYNFVLFISVFILLANPFKAIASYDPIFTNYLEQIKDKLPSGWQMRLPSKIRVNNLVDGKNKQYLIRVIWENSSSRLTVNLFSCDSGELSCLVGSFSVDSNTSVNAQQAFKKHKLAAAPITLKDGIQGYLFDELKQQPSTEFSSVMWEQEGFFYTVEFNAQERQNILYMASSMVKETPIYSAVVSTDTRSEVNQTVSTSPSTPSNIIQPQETVNKKYLLLNLSDRRVYVYKDGKLQASYPVAIGRSGWETPTGTFAVINMEQNPIWQNPFTQEIIPAGSQNPLGVAWIGFLSNGGAEIGFHGTTNEKLIGQAVSHGCVRMRNQDILKLYQQVTIGMPVKVVP